MDLSEVSEELANLERQIIDISPDLLNEFQKLEKDLIKRSRQLEKLRNKIQEFKRLINNSDQVAEKAEGTSAGDTNKMLSDNRQSMVKGSNTCAPLKKQQANTLDSIGVDIFDALGEEAFNDKHVLSDSVMGKQQLMNNNHQMMNETNQAIERSRKSTEQMSRTVNAPNSIRIFMKKALLFVKQLCIEAAHMGLTYFMLLLVVIVIIIVVPAKLEQTRKMREGFVWTCTPVPGTFKDVKCSWTKEV